MYMPTTYPGVSIGQARQILQQTDKIIRTVPEVKTVFGKVGRAETATDPAPLTMIETFIQLKPQSEWREGVTTDSLKKSWTVWLKYRVLPMPGSCRLKPGSTCWQPGLKPRWGLRLQALS